MSYIASTARVEKTVLVWHDAQVIEYATVKGSVTLLGQTIVKGNAYLSGHVWISGMSMVQDHVRLTGALTVHNTVIRGDVAMDKGHLYDIYWWKNIP